MNVVKAEQFDECLSCVKYLSQDGNFFEIAIQKNLEYANACIVWNG